MIGSTNLHFWIDLNEIHQLLKIFLKVLVSETKPILSYMLYAYFELYAVEVASIGDQKRP